MSTVGGRAASTATKDGDARGAAASDNRVREEKEGVDAVELWWRWSKSIASGKLFGSAR